MWTIGSQRDLKRFKFPTRTTEEGSIDPYGGKTMPKLADLDRPGYFTASGGFARAATANCCAPNDCHPEPMTWARSRIPKSSRKNWTSCSSAAAWPAAARPTR